MATEELVANSTEARANTNEPMRSPKLKPLRKQAPNKSDDMLLSALTLLSAKALQIS